MEDREIVDLYWARDGQATAETQTKYGAMLLSLSGRFVKCREDAEECVNDTYFAAWNAMPQDRPVFLGAYLSKIVRRISIRRFRYQTAEKRAGTEELSEELEACIPDSSSGVEKTLEEGALRNTLDAFLASLEKEKRIVFVRRYFYNDSVSEIAALTGLSEGNIKVILHRTREKLKEKLTEEELL